MALEVLGARPDLVFATEKDKATRAMIKHNFPIARGVMCSDITTRDDATLPAVDLYTAGPPCQSFRLQETTRAWRTPGAWFSCAC